MDAGLEVFDLTEYPSLIRGGHNAYTLRVSPTAYLSHVETVDILVALNREPSTCTSTRLVDGGALVYDPETRRPTVAAEPRQIRPVAGAARQDR